MTEEEVRGRIASELKSVTPVVREGVYTGDDCDEYITFVTSSRGISPSNNRPGAVRVRLTATLWARHGTDVSPARRKMYAAIRNAGGTYPECLISSEDGWQMTVYESEFLAAREE